MNGMHGNLGADAAEPIHSSRKPGEKYDVFLSFRGPDTREGFADCLFEFLTDAGIRVFMDDEELRVGESIGWEIKRAIYDSKLFVPVFSRRFASSKWCLREIEWMTDCLEEYPGKKEMLPVFYDVDAGDVKLKTDLYANALIKHMETSGHENVENWRKALIKIPRLKGWNRADVKGQGKLIKRITHHICRKLEIKHRILPDHFIGVEEQVQDIIDKLDCGSRDVRIIVIHGMGGIGKTTLASAVFNKIYWQFQGYSFLSNVRESSAGNRIVDLQNKLLRDLLRFSRYNFRDANDAMNCIQGSLHKKNALVVLDDVSDVDQFGKLVGMGEWLGLGSRVIITTRNLHCIANGADIENDAWISQGKKIYIYKMRELGSDDSLRLLCRHAFGKDVPPSDYERPSHDILSLVGGIPLAIEVIGSYLRQGSVAIWGRMFNKLKKIPHERLYREILKSSYEILSDEEKEIFLDFFLAGRDKTTSFYYWEACGLFPEINLHTLISYALIKIDYYNIIQIQISSPH
ncbi:hypothetical protein MLD38_009321 [Melastoma candidum]|uniref:Uncharacterized protein n=1 Tax=Melastoma candidum TaxID=119954 RepID=A0ACB9RWU8_9MYRT|nr:hypothetical protein MLD38_009321 [Melastoma candidum]